MKNLRWEILVLAAAILIGALAIASSMRPTGLWQFVTTFWYRAEMRTDREASLARARAEMLNLAVAAYFQGVGDRTTAKANWSSAGSDASRYSLLKPYIAFPTDTLTDFMPSPDYRVVFDPTDPLIHKATLYGPSGEISY
jgi:hypothetical protein